MAEGDLQDPRNAPRPPARICEYISDIALNGGSLLRLMEKFGISPRLRQANPVAAVDSMRDDIEIEVARNYFLLDRDEGGEPRTASIVLSFTSGNRDLAQAVAHDIGSALLESQAASRSAELNRARAVVAGEAQHVRFRLQQLQARLSTLLLRQAAGTRSLAEVRAEIATLQYEISAARSRASDLEKRAADLDVALQAEQQQLGLRFHLVDESVNVRRGPLRGGEAIGYAAFVLAFLLPMVAVLFGAFDERIYRAADLGIHGFPILGVVPRFPGDEAGAYLERSGRTLGSGASIPWS
jgi:chaperonin cofactor prefoldin